MNAHVGQARLHYEGDAVTGTGHRDVWPSWGIHYRRSLDVLEHRLSRKDHHSVKGTTFRDANVGSGQPQSIRRSPVPKHRRLRPLNILNYLVSTYEKYPVMTGSHRVSRGCLGQVWVEPICPVAD